MDSNNNDKRLRCRGPSFLQKLWQRDGEFTLNGALMLLFASMLLVLGISVLGAVNDAMKLHTVAADLSRYIEIRGRVDSPVYAELDRLANVAGVTIEHYTIQTAEGSEKIQFGASFSITLETTAHFGIGGILTMPVPLKTTVSGRGERYWK